jgi:beta-galactosidase
MRYEWLAGLALSALVPTAALTQGKPAPVSQDASNIRSVVDLSAGWRFHKGDDAAQAPEFSDANWQLVRVPHSWNRIGQYEAAAKVETNRPLDTYQGIAWYRLNFDAPLLRNGQRLWLEFDAASRRAEIWVNGRKLGMHDSGFSRFRLDATDLIKPGTKNLLAVKVDNSAPKPGSATADSLPLLGDFVVQGGLYRPVRMVVTNAAHVDMTDHGGPGIYARTDRIDAAGASVSLLSRFANDGGAAFSGTARARLLAADGTVAAEASTPVRLGTKAKAEIHQQLTVPKPRLWQGTSDPYLYNLEVELRDRKGQVVDVQRQAYGIREIRIDPAKGFFLNGKHVPLRGVGFHQDSMESGWGMTEAEIADRVATIRDMGANTIRLTHYQHGQTVHDLADRYGLILWDEIALVTAWTLEEAQGAAPAGIRAQARQQLQEMIRQNYNHPSVAVWGIANEVDFGPGRPDFLGRGVVVTPSDPSPFLRELNALAIAEDPSRRTTLATCCEDRDMPDIPDVAGITQTSGANRYFGWYYGKPEGLAPHLDALHAKRPGQPQSLTEYGAGGALSLHTDDPLGGPIDMGGRNQPEEYQSWLHEKSWPIIADRPFIWASWIWNSFDFATSTRTEGDARDINTKGLVSYDGKIRKDAFYYYRANWSPDPTVHLAGRRYTDRAYQSVDVRAYSNAPTTELRLNGRSIGTMNRCDNGTCIWPEVRLEPGENRLEAIGKFDKGETRDVVTWQLASFRRNAYRIDAGALIAAQVSGEGFGSDAFFKGGEAASLDKRPRGRPPVLAAIQSPDRRDLLATFREGTFSYQLPLEAGRYTVTVTFVEGTAAEGERSFDVAANGKVMLENVDVIKLAGGALKPLVRTFQVEARSGALDLVFAPHKGKAIVSAIEVVPVSAQRKAR